MKNFVTGMLSLIVLCCFSFTYAKTGDLNVTYVNQRISSCNPNQSKEVDYYITGTSYTVYPLDNFRSDNLGNLLIGGKNNGSSIDIRSNGVISNCDDWGRASFVAPNKMWVRVFQNYDGCTFKIGKQSTDFVAQIHYNVGYKKIKSCSSNDPSVNGPLSYFPKDGTDYEYYGNSNQTICYNNTLYIHTGECLNYRIFRCGDGLINGHNGKTSYNNGTFVEQCDPKAPQWSGNNACDPVTCKSKTPVCKSQYNGQSLPYDIVPGNYLCEVGTMTGFNYNESTHTWTWKCDNVAGTSVNCSAKKSINGTLDIEKKLIGETNYVTEVGQELVWEVKVTAKGGDVKDVQIKDYLPEVLEYVRLDGNPILPSGVTMNSIKPDEGADTTGHYLLWSTEGILSNGESIILMIRTKVKTMPKTTDNYENVACAWAEGLDEECKPVPVETKGGLNIKKKIIQPSDGVVTHTGEEVVWKITVTAEGGNVIMQEIYDTLPEELSYITGKFVHLPETITISKDSPLFSNGNKKVTWKTTGTLKSGDYIELHLYTTLVKMPKQNEVVKNVACAKTPGDEPCATGQTTKLRIKKVILDSNNEEHKNITLQPGDFITYKITFGNMGDTAARASIKDFLPKGVEYISGSLNVHLSNGNESLSYDGNEINLDGVDIALYSGILLQPGYEGVLIIHAKIPETIPDVARNTTNFACIYNESGTRIDCDNAVYNIGMMCKKLDIKGGTTLIKGGSKEVECTTTQGQVASTIEIDCGNGAATIKGSKVSSLTGLCIYPSGEKTYNLTCKVDGKTTDSCQGSITVTEPGTSETNNPVTPRCATGTWNNDNSVTCEAKGAIVYFQLACIKNGTRHIIDTSGKAKRDHTFYNVEPCDGELRCLISEDGRSWGSQNYCVIDNNSSEPMQGCFNVNEGNFSIEEGEIMPFYWNMANLNDEYYNNKNIYTEINGNYKHAKDNYEKKEGTECTDEGKIATDSMVCTFIISDGGANHYGVKTGSTTPYYDYLYKIEGPCLSKDNAIRKSNLIGARYDKMVETYCGNTNKKCYFYYDETEGITKYNINNYKEAVLPTAVYYIQKFGSGAQIYANVGGDSREIGGNIKSENNKAFGEYKISITGVNYLQCENGKWTQQNSDKVCQTNLMLTNSYTVQKTPSGNLKASTAKLHEYLSYNGERVFEELLKAIETTVYNKNTNVENAMKSFIDKYSKLAVAVDLKGNSFLDSFSIKKVPGKNIYFVDGDLTINGGGSIKNPFTIVQTTGTTTIKGNIDHNMMLLTNGDIRFDGSCEIDQTVKGIFYARGKLNRGLVKKNTSIDNDKWCTKGGLHVKGVLIGDNFDKLMNNSRSHINDWFTGQGDPSSRRKYIMNGASVLIEYSPSIFTKSTMPPGAEDFTTALSIYKN